MTTSSGTAARDSSLLNELAALASGLCQDARVNLEIGLGWSWDPARRVLTVDRAELQRRGVSYCAGVIAHEVGHVLISRYLSFSVDFPSQRAGFTVLNGVEDPRVERWITGRFPGALPWLEAGRGEAHPSVVASSAFMSFCFECAAEGERHFEPTDAMLPQGVRSALDATRDVRKRYVQTTPPTDLRADDAGLHTAYMSEVHPNLTHTSWPPPRREQAVRLSAWQAFRLAAEEILPVAQSLYVTDTNRLARHLQRNPEAAQRARAQLGRGGAWSELEGALRRGATDNQGERPAGEAARELAQALLDDALGGRAHRPLIASDAGVFTREDMKAGTPAATAMPVLRLPESTAPYDVAYRQVAAQVEDLVRHLDEVLRPRKRLTRRSGYASGQRLDLRRVMAWEADPKQWNRIWSRTTIPERREVAVGLLVDLSGSMSGAPARHALLGTVLLAETLHRLQVPFAIDGFQDVLIPFHDFDDPLDAHVRQRIAEMPKEVDGSRQGGHNSPGHNDDGPCLMEFAEKVSGQAATDRVLLVLSDGEPAGRRSNSQDLRNAVRVLSEPAAGLRLIGLGLGPGTEHVRSFYPEHEANVPLEELASRIGALLERVLIG